LAHGRESQHSVFVQTIIKCSNHAAVWVWAKGLAKKNLFTLKFASDKFYICRAL